MIAGGVKIGVLGGIGPEASAEFYARLIEQLQKRSLVKKNADYPQIIINSINAPDGLRTGDTKDFLEPYMRGLNELESNNVDFIVMVCNTIHLLYDEITKTIRTPVIDLRKEVRALLLKQKVKLKSLATIGTKNTINSELYDLSGINTIKPDEQDLEKLETAISMFNIGADRDKQIKTVKAICDKCTERGAPTILLGCTELAIMMKDCGYIDSISVLVDATINKFLEVKNGN